MCVWFSTSLARGPLCTQCVPTVGPLGRPLPPVGGSPPILWTPPNYTLIKKSASDGTAAPPPPSPSLYNNFREDMREERYISLENKDRDDNPGLSPLSHHPTRDLRGLASSRLMMPAQGGQRLPVSLPGA